MAPKRRSRGSVDVDATAAQKSAPVFVADGYVVPSSIPAKATLPDGTTVSLAIEVSGDPPHARAVRMTVESEQGIGWTTLANVPVRDIVATAVLAVLMRATVGRDGSIALAPPAKGQEQAAWEVMRTLVGYVPNTDGLVVAS